MVLMVLFVSCRTHEIAYISDVKRDSAQAILDTYTVTVLPGDQLYIYVSSQTPESVIPFNQETHTFVMEQSRLDNLDTSRVGVIEQESGKAGSGVQYVSTTVTGYNVSESGCIMFPVLGEIPVVGLTLDSLCHYMERRLKEEGYVVDPQVTAKLLNFRVTVVGEVRRPQQIHVEGTRLTILEAIAICGDVSEYGMRDKVVVVRDNGGRKEIGEIDLTKKEMLDSPYYYLHNSDIVYVEPMDKYKRMSDRDNDVPRYVAIGVSVWSIITTNINTARWKRQH